MVVASTAENASAIVVGPAVAGPAVVVGRLPARGPVSEVAVERVGAVVGARGPVVGVDVDLGAGSAGTVGSARAGARRGGDGWGSRVAEATRAARTPVVSPKATSMSRQAHRDLVRCRGGAGRCRGGGVDMGHGPGSTATSRPARPTPFGALPGRIPLRRWPCSPEGAGSTGGTRSKQSTRRTLVSLPRHAAHAKACRHETSGWQVDGRGLVHVWSTCHRSRAVRNGLQRSPAVGRSRRLPARSCGNRPAGRTLIRMRSPVNAPAALG